MPNNHYKFETLQLHVGQETPDPATDARAVPIYATTSYVFRDSTQAAGRFGLTEGGNIYTRLMNPTSDVFEKRVAALESGAGALATATGAAAITYAVQNIARAGDHIVSSETIYGGTYNLFANTFGESGIETTFVDGSDPGNFEKAVRPNTKAIFLESLGNPNSDIIDLEAVSEIAHRNGIPVIVDNTFATPYLFRPIEHGADVVVHSATKFIGGHGTVMGGVIIDSGKFDWAQNDKFPGLSGPNLSYHGIVFTEVAGNLAYIVKIRTTLMRDTGATISPFNSFLLLQGLETLSLRVERHVENALKVVAYLKNHPQVERVNHPSLASGTAKELYDRYYPGGGASIFTFEIRGSEEQARKFTESLELFSLLANVADVKSLVKLYQRVVMLGCDCVVTGHYARIENEGGRYLLKKAADNTKDQSYVLYFMTQEQLRHSQFPLGEMRKTDIRKIAEEYGFVNARKRESQDICFVPGGDYAKVIEAKTGRTYPSGNFIDRSGNILGEHKGIIRYTIGQRKGLGLAFGERMYVFEKSVSGNTVTLGRNEDLFSKELDAADFNWIAFDKPPEKIRVRAKVRYRQPEQWATAECTGTDAVHVVFDEPQRAIAKDQAVVLYDGDTVVGGGIIS